MKNTKGFTLIEIIAVIALLAVIGLVAAPSIIRSLKTADTNQYDGFVEDLYLATETYINLNESTYANLKTVGGTATITIGKLREEKLVKAKLVNPKTNKTVPDSASVKVTVQADLTFKYEYIDAS